MKNMRHPNFILAIVSIVIMFIGIGLKANGYRAGDYVLIGAVAVGAIHYVWSIIDVANRTDMKAFQKRFWLLAVIAIPAFGSLIFYIMHQTRGRITT